MPTTKGLVPVELIHIVYEAHATVSAVDRVTVFARSQSNYISMFRRIIKFSERCAHGCIRTVEFVGRGQESLADVRDFVVLLVREVCSGDWEAGKGSACLRINVSLCN